MTSFLAAAGSLRATAGATPVAADARVHVSAPDAFDATVDTKGGIANPVAFCSNYQVESRIVWTLTNAESGGPALGAGRGASPVSTSRAFRSGATSPRRSPNVMATLTADSTRCVSRRRPWMGPSRRRSGITSTQVCRTARSPRSLAMTVVTRSSGPARCRRPPAHQKRTGPAMLTVSAGTRCAATPSPVPSPGA
jgi:hypothetical protein